MDLSAVLWIGSADPAVAQTLAARHEIPLHDAGDARSMQRFRSLLGELAALDAERQIDAGRFAPPAVAAVLRSAGQAVFLPGDDAVVARDARVLRLRVVADGAVADAEAALGLSGAAGTWR